MRERIASMGFGASFADAAVMSAEANRETSERGMLRPA